MKKPDLTGAVISWKGFDFVPIPKGLFVMGSHRDNELAWDDEKPQQMFEMAYAYWMSKFPISNESFRDFVRSTVYKTRAEHEGWAWAYDGFKEKWVKTPGANWQKPGGKASVFPEKAHHPVVSICWYDALAFCDWVNQNSVEDLPCGYHVRLPTEAEWEKAARGEDGREWPWGDGFTAALCNSRESGWGGTTPIGWFSPGGDSTYGISELSGNVWEWTVTLWGSDPHHPSFSYPYSADDGRENLKAGEANYRIIRGGSFKDDRKGVRCACRDLDPPNYSLNNLGMRIVIAPLLGDGPVDQTGDHEA